MLGRTLAVLTGLRCYTDISMGSDLPRNLETPLPEVDSLKPNKPPVTYASAGVDLSLRETEPNSASSIWRRKTFNKQVLGEIGGFGGLFRLDIGQVRKPNPGIERGRRWYQAEGGFRTSECITPSALTSSITVSMTLPSRARPRLFFLDYLAIGQLDDEVAQTVVSGVAEACRANGCALIGGETAQMPGFYSNGEYDLAGFIVGAVDKEKLITGSKIEARRCVGRLSFHRFAHQWLFTGAQAVLRK